MNAWNSYFVTHTVSEAMEILHRMGKNARVVAGGTDLILDLEFGRQPAVDTLVDITAINGWDRIEEDGRWIIIGSAATHAAIASHSLINLHGTALAEAAVVVGGPQVRNVATIGGNVAHALPAADGTTALVALEAEALVFGPEGPAVDGEWRPIVSLFSGPGRTSLGHQELIGAFRIPSRKDRSGSAFDRVMRPQGIALPMLGCAMSVETAEDGTISHASVCFGPAGPVPFRATKTEEVLTGRRLDGTSLEAAVEMALEEASLRTSRHRATKEYRREIVDVLIRRVLARAVARTR